MNLKIASYSLFLIIIVFACNHTTDNNKTVFRYNEIDAVTSLDPIYTRNLSNINVCNHLFNGLVQLDDSLNILPCCAKYWQISEGGKKYVFILRDDVFFHKHPAFGADSTRRVKASDFVYSLNRLIDVSLASPGAWVMNNVERLPDKTLHLEAPNDTILIFHLNSAFSPFLGILSMKYCSVVPKEIVSLYGKEFRKKPIGTGPFLFKYWKENEKLILLKNQNYFEFDSVNVKLPYIDAVAISFIQDKQTVALEFIKNNFDYMSGIEPSFLREFVDSTGNIQSKYNKNFYLLTKPYLNTEYIGFNLNDSTSILLDINIRKAINYAIDKEKMIKYLRAGIGTVGYSGFIPKGLNGYSDTNYYNYNPNLAVELIKESKYCDKLPDNVINIATTIEYSDLLNYIQAALNNVGIKIKVDIYPPAIIKELRANSKLQCFRGSWVADYPDAENYLSVFYSENNPPYGPNYCHFNNSDFDNLYNLALQETDNKKRILLYNQMDKILIKEAPFVILYYDHVLRFVNNNVKDLGINPINLLDLKKTKIINY